MRQIVLIGPPAAGKSTIASMLSRKLGIRNVPLDSVRWGYYYRVGYDHLVEQDLVERGGFKARFFYWKPFEAYAAERVLVDFPDAIIDFGAGHSVYDDPEQFDRVSRALASADHVILLMPDPNLETSLRILLGREPPPHEYAEVFSNEVRGMLENPSNYKLATATVYTNGRSPEEICAEIETIISAESRAS